MQRRLGLMMLGAGVAAALIAMGPSPALSATAHAARPAAKSVSEAAHDLTGVWTHAWYTHLERPKAFKGLIATPAEAAAYEAPRRALHGELTSKDDVVGQSESEFPDNGPGLARIRGEVRSSWIIDPADGRIPWIAAQKTRLRIGEMMPPETYDNVEERDTDERCLTASGSGVPMINAHDANLVEIVQSPDWVAILMEKNHETRFVRIQRPSAAPSPPPPGLGAWMGVSTGRWEGPTLVVETTGFRPGFTAMHDVLKLSEHARVVERFTRAGPGVLAYEFDVTDPTLFTRPWRAEMVFRPAEGQLYEYACHEGNYSLPGILAAARAAEREKAGR